MTPQLIVEQKITAFANKYMVYAANEQGLKGQMIAFAQQKRLAFKEKVIFYNNATKSQEVFSFRAEKVMDVHGRFLVEAPDGKLVGAFRKDFKKSLLSSTWHVLDDNSQSLVTISESSQTLAVIRRVVGFIPIIGDLVELVVAFFRYHFVFREAASGEAMGKYQKTTLFRDHYLLSMDSTEYQKIDWRTWAAISVALDALQSR